MKFDPDTGEFIDDGDGDGDDRDYCNRCATHVARAEALEADIVSAERDLRKARRAIRALEAELKKQREDSPEGRVARALFKYWCARLDKNPKRSKFGEKRQKVVIARLKDGYLPSYIARAIDGLAVGAYTNPDTGLRYDDLELVCRNEVNLERFHRTAEAMDAPTLVGDAWVREFEGADPGESESDTPF